MLNDYHFITHWRVRGNVAEVIDILKDAEDLPRWWPSVYIEVKKRADIVELFTKGWLPYTLRWSFRVLENRPDGFVIEAFGDFIGCGEWTLTQSGDDVDIIYDWRIRAEKPLLRLFSPLLKPIFGANHRWAMSRGEESLKIELARRHGEPHIEPPKATFRKQNMHSSDWSTLNHAYGPADDIPALLERARHAAAPENYKDEPWFSLWSALCHQGDVYTASYAAVPQLVAIAEARAAEPKVAAQCLFLAGIIELERALPEGPAPPTIPAELTSSYTTALQRGAELAAALLAAAAEPETRKGLAVSHAALRGDVAEARVLSDGPEQNSE